MIFLFNSASRPLYATNALSVLALPKGATILHRYRVSGAYFHVHADLRQAITGNGSRRLKRVRRERDLLVRLGANAEAVVICFVDRYSPTGYRYYPQRLGSLVDAWETDERMYFRVRLLDFIAAPEGKALELSTKIKEALADKKPPTLVVGKPEDKNDGNYAIHGPDIREWPGLLRGESAWVGTVRALSGTQKLGHSNSQRVVYMRTQLRRLSSDSDPETPGTVGGADRVGIRKDAIYELRISYQCPGQKTGSGSVAGIRIEHGESLQILEAGELPINAEADEISIPIATKRYAEDRYSVLRLDVTAPAVQATGASGVGQAPEVLGPKLNLLIALREGRMFWPKVVAAVGLFAIASLVVALDKSAFSGQPASSWIGILWAQATPPRIIAAILQAFALLALFRLIGKKPV